MSEILDPSPAAKPLIDGYIGPFLKMVFATVKEMVDDSVCESKIHQLSFSVISQCVWYRFAGDINRMVISEDQFASNFSINGLAKQIYDFSLAGINAANSESTAKTDAGSIADETRKPDKQSAEKLRAVVESASSSV